MMRCRQTIGILTLALSLAGPGARAAHDWRAAWGSPYPLLLAGQSLRGSGESRSVEVQCAQPFGLSNVFYQSAIGCLRSYEIHVGTLQAPGYCEWQAGASRYWRAGPHLSILTGLRGFGIRAGGESFPPCGAFTLLAACEPFHDVALRFTAGLVDAAWNSAGESPPALFIGQAVYGRSGRRLLVQRQVCAGGKAETIVGVSLAAGELELTHCLRAELGEASILLSVAQIGLSFSAGTSCHPELGWTPLFTLRWSAETNHETAMR